MAKPTTAVTTTPAAIDDIAAIQAALSDMGLTQIGDGSTQARVKVNGSSFEFPDGEIYPSNQKTKAPAFYGRLLDVPLEYQAAFLEEQDAITLNRPDMANRFCKSYFHIPEQGGKVAEDGTPCTTCPINPFTNKDTNPLGKKCQWRAEIVFQHCDENGSSEDTTEYTLSLSTTSVMELKGTRKEKVKGYVSEYNFMHKLARFGIANIPSAASVAEAVTQIGTALRVGQVIVAFRIAQASADNGSRSWPIVVLDPVNVVLADETPSIPAKTTTPTHADNYEDDNGEQPF